MRQRRDTMERPSSRVISEQMLTRFNFPARCDLFRPATLLPIPGGDNPSGLQVGDSGYELALQNAEAFFSPAPENDQPTVMGRVESNNIFTLDKFILRSGVEVHDTWVLVYLGAGDNYREVYVVQGDPQSGNPHPFHATDQQIILAKRIPKTEAPVGVTVRDPLGLVPGV